MDSMQGNYRIYTAGSAIFTYSKQSCRNLKERNAKGNRQGTLRKEGALGRLLYLSLISSLKRCSPPVVTPFSLCCAGRGAAGRLLPSPPGSARGECPRRCNDGHRLLDFASPILGIGSGQPDGESSAVYLKGQAAALVIVRQAAAGGIFCRIEQKIADAVGKDNYLCDIEIDKDWLQNGFQLDMSKVESYVAKQNSIGSVNPDTVIVLKTKDGYASDAVKALNIYYAQVVSYIRQYPFGTAKVMNACIYQSGDYVLYIIAGASYDGEDSEAENKLAVSEYAKIDEDLESVLGTLLENLAVVPEA